MLGFYAYMQAALGPATPFLRAELHLNYTVAGLHLTAFALGMVIAGSTADAAAERLGRYRVFWIGGGCMTLGGLLFIAAQTVVLSIAASFSMGFLGTYLLVMVQSTLSDHHGAKRAIALTEANIGASGFATLAPLLIGLGAKTGVGWRLGYGVGALMWGIAYFSQRRTPIPKDNGIQTADSPAPSQKKKALPRLFWLYWGVIFIGVAVEWSVLFWTADFLETHVGFSRSDASTLVSVFLIAMIMGRFIGSRLTHYLSAETVLNIAIWTAGIGFPIYWLSEVKLLNLVGLYVVGIGVANLFPMCLSIASDIGVDRSDAASARVSLAGGSAILILPQILGSLADQVGIFNAFSVIAILLVILTGFTVFGGRLRNLTLVRSTQ